METSLSGWEEDRLLGALVEIQGETDETEVLLRALQLHRSIANGMIKVGEKKDKQSLEKQSLDIEEVKNEMSRMEAELNQEDDTESAPKESEMIVDADSGAKGWSKWEGPWVPKPIGVI